MVARAHEKYTRISPFKLRKVIALIKGEKARGAFSILEATNKKGAEVLKKALRSALTNAKNKGYSEDGLFISKLIINSGPSLKRYRAASFGRATIIRKRTSHILVELDTPEKLIKKTKLK